MPLFIFHLNYFCILKAYSSEKCLIVCIQLTIDLLFKLIKKNLTGTLGRAFLYDSDSHPFGLVDFDQLTVPATHSPFPTFIHAYLHVCLALSLHLN